MGVIVFIINRMRGSGLEGEGELCGHLITAWEKLNGKQEGRRDKARDSGDPILCRIGNNHKALPLESDSEGKYPGRWTDVDGGPSPAR